MLSEEMAINMVQEQQLARQDAESQLERQKLLNRLLAVVLIIVVSAGLLTRSLLNKNQSTFRRQFKERYGTTALKYRKCLYE